MAKVLHYASLLQGETEVFGTAELVVGSYIFRSDANPRKAIAIDYRNADPMLFGLKPLADAQWQADCAHGDLAALRAS
jgi:hypothetical protein